MIHLLPALKEKRKDISRGDPNKIHRGVEQLVARRAHNPKVVGSSPAPATTERHWRNPVPFFMKVSN